MPSVRPCLTAFALCLGLAATLPLPASADDNAASDPRLVLITSDGLRWQEVFRGADEALLNKQDGGVANVEALRSKYWRDTPEERRKALMPFFWSTLVPNGQVFGNADAGSPAKVTNGKNFSYPGYSELFTGKPDDRIDSNDKFPNPNVNVLEWLNGKPAFKGKVAAVGSWELYPYILNQPRSGLAVNAGWAPIEGDSLTEAQRTLNTLMGRIVPNWPTCRDDAFTFPVALEHLKSASPRVLYIGYGDTDEHAHHGRYDLYLDAIHAFDADLKQLWDEIQARPETAGKTSLLITTDHGRGDPPRGWRDHGAKTPGSEFIWIAGLGPKTPPLGERRDTPPVTQSQVAATAAALVGEDYRADHADAAPPIADLVRGGKD